MTEPGMPAGKARDSSGRDRRGPWLPWGITALGLNWEEIAVVARFHRRVSCGGVERANGACRRWGTDQPGARITAAATWGSQHEFGEILGAAPRREKNKNEGNHGRATGTSGGARTPRPPRGGTTRRDHLARSSGASTPLFLSCCTGLGAHQQGQRLCVKAGGEEKHRKKRGARPSVPVKGGAHAVNASDPLPWCSVQGRGDEVGGGVASACAPATRPPTAGFAQPPGRARAPRRASESCRGCGHCGGSTSAWCPGRTAPAHRPHSGGGPAHR